MMKILSINSVVTYDNLNIISIIESEIPLLTDLESYDYIIINGGDGTIRRVIKLLHDKSYHAKFIINPTGSFNVIAKLHHVPKLNSILSQLANNKIPHSNCHQYYTLNKEIFLFSAGNMGDLQHIFLSETLRFGLLKKGILKYLLAGFFLAPVHIIMTPFMLLSKRKFFIFTPAKFISKFGTFYGRVEEEITIDLENEYNLIELDGDVVTINERMVKINYSKSIHIIQ